MTSHTPLTDQKLDEIEARTNAATPGPWCTPSIHDHQELTMSTDPSGCRWCGIGQREHMQRWKPPVGWHKWTTPTQQQTKTRMLARRARRNP